MKKELKYGFFSFLLIVTIVLYGGSFLQTASASSDTFLSSLEPVDSHGFYSAQWNSSNPFADSSGKKVSHAVGLSNDYRGTAYATYKLENKSFKTFQGKITLDSKWLKGDYGKTTVAFYSDDRLLYEKALTSTTPSADLKVSLPKNIEHFYVIVRQQAGSKGTHGVIVQEGNFLTSGSYLNTPEADYDSALTVNASYKSSNYSDTNNSSTDFKDINGNLITEGIAFLRSYGGGEYATFDIKDASYTKFETKLSLDADYIKGNYGRTIVGIYADDYLLYEKELTSKTSVQTVKTNIPKGTNQLTLVVKQLGGSKGVHRVVFINPVFKAIGTPITVPYTISPMTVTGESSSSFNSGSIYSTSESSIPQYSNGSLATTSMIFEKGYSGQIYASYNMSDTDVNFFKAKLSVDGRYINGDYGTSVIKIYANNQVIYSNTLTKKTGVIDLNLKLPSHLNTFKIVTDQKAGTKGDLRVTLGNPVFQKMPASANLAAKQISVVNNYNKADTVTVKSLSKGDKVKVYNTKGQLLATSAAAAKDSVTVSINQLGTGKGTVLVSRITGSKLESDKTSAAYGAEVKPAVSSAVVAKNVTVVNNRGKDDVITVKGLSKNDIAKVYDSKGKLLATSKPAAKDSVVMYVKQLGTAKGTVLVSRTSINKLESSKTSVNYAAEPSVSTKLVSSQVKVVNNRNKNDIVTVNKLAKGEKVKVYNSKGQLLATSDGAAKDNVIVSIKQLGSSKGTVLVSRISPSKLESDKISVNYNAE
ncbi:NPCBM/NEW2 domain-containing protein [Priestia megaterium]|uniref:NPCBM/NEW2 domain-containing protein n=1 Tax=Priestia megaterium TaxID=1404 RepID=UPI002E1BABCB|nr:NPCBM/NEW2 domain-containing protein [Priestia megaterium]